MNLVDRILRLHHVLSASEIAHAFGGALALAWCTERARATIDIDINVFVGVSEAEGVFDALPDDIGITDHDRQTIARDGQTRL